MVTTYIHIEQEDETPQTKVTKPSTAMTHNTSSDSGFDWDFLGTLNTTGGRHKIMLGDKAGNVTPMVRADSDPESGSELHFLVGPLRQFRCGMA